MSNDTSQDLQLFLNKQQPDFALLNEANDNPLNFRQECLFARQQIMKNSFTLKIARENQASLRDAISNVAAIGISLNPASHHAYLVPRDGKVCLDVSYRGLIKLATDTGVIKWAKAELVYANDTFVYLGVSTPPNFSADVFGDRGELVGGFCIAKTNDGDHLIEIMNLEELQKTRDTSQAYKFAETKDHRKGSGQKNSVWHLWEAEMYKKTLIKRSAKTWPQSSGRRQRLDKAIDVVNQHEGLELEPYTLEEKETLDGFIGKNDTENPMGCVDFVVFIKGLSDSSRINLNNSFPQGQIGKMKKIWAGLEAKGYAVLTELSIEIEDAYKGDNEEDAVQAIHDLPENVLNLAYNMCSSAAREWASSLEIPTE